ncbi:MAG TPA: 5-formyltetrahydrofolate cyclo-ligase [Cyclobacteriaceae bacterium]|nr:5-formyltetrahydrofolate cyclo-ligase [Cyclobacteriaceae bacterium]
MTKQELRKIYLAKRAALSEAEYLHMNRQICEQFFFNFDLSFIKVIHTYLPISSKREPDTWLIIDRIRREYPHIRIAIPKVNAEKNELEHYFFEGLHQLNTNSWGIQEPKQGIPCEPEKLDLVLVPLLAYDQQGHRLGYGKGYYDKFLVQCRVECKKIGIAFFEAETVIPEIHPLDEKLKAVLNPYRIINFNQGLERME